MAKAAVFTVKRCIETVFKLHNYVYNSVVISTKTFSLWDSASLVIFINIFYIRHWRNNNTSEGYLSQFCTNFSNVSLKRLFSCLSLLWSSLYAKYNICKCFKIRYVCSDQNKFHYNHDSALFMTKQWTQVLLYYRVRRE